MCDRTHSRSLACSTSASIGKSDTRQLASSEFNKYAGDDDKDYDDVIGKLNGSCVRFFLHFLRDYLTGHHSAGTSCAEAAAQHVAIE